MKNNIFILLVLITSSICAQTMSLKKVNRYFDNKSYTTAIEGYSALKNKTLETQQNLADSYFYTLDMENAIATYKSIIEEFAPITDSNRLFRYAQALKTINEFDASDKILATLFDKPFNYNEFTEDVKKNAPHVFSEKEILNKDGKSDFGMSFYLDNKVAFASARNEESPLYTWNNLPYLDLYSATLTTSGELTDVEPFGMTVNTESHESNATFTQDGKTMYFNRTNPERILINDTKIANIKIYKAELENEKWTNITALPFSSDLYSIEHPSLSKDGKTLYFSSDMPGGFGSFDLYKVAINADGTFGVPENLGDKINTSQREQFPYISRINTLYFSSNGHEGFGNLDVFRSELINDSFSNPFNLGTGVNSNLDDFGYSIDEKKNFGFFSSNRTKEDKLYRFNREDNILTKYLVEGIVQDKHSKEILPGSLVTLFDENRNVIQDTIVGKD
uniref:hypothetical protein n=1 Tax=Aurantibacter sp. TaxID=2807103 RepID=UPI0035C7E779